MLKQTQTWPQRWQMPAPFRRAWHGPSSWRSGRPHRFAGIARDHGSWVLGGWLVVVFLLGGGARDDVQSLMILRPLSALVFAYALWNLSGERAAAHRSLLGFAVAWAALHLLQLVPLPPQWWQTLPGREVIAEIDRAAGLGDVWRPLTMVPHGTRNAAWALLAPAVVLLLGIGIAARDRRRLLPVVLGLGLLSAVIGGLQLAAAPQSGLFFYRITNNGSAVGLFANRNHHAIFLALLPPMLLVWATLRSGWRAPRSRADWTHWACAAGGVVLVVPLILVIGSRAGLMITLLGMLAAPLLLAGLPRAEGMGTLVLGRPRRFYAIAFLVLAAAGLVLLTVLLGRGLAFDRLIASDATDLRFRVLGTLGEMVELYLPWGSGFGSFTEVYQLHEPRHLLAPAYLNHAHNDWLESALTGGVPAMVLAGLAIVGFLVRAVRLARPAPGGDRGEVLLGRLGLLILLMLALASFGDYPLRTPALACLAAVAALWAAPGRPTCGLRNP